MEATNVRIDNLSSYDGFNATFAVNLIKCVHYLFAGKVRGYRTISAISCQRYRKLRILYRSLFFITVANPEPAVTSQLQYSSTVVSGSSLRSLTHTFLNEDLTGGCPFCG